MGNGPCKRRKVVPLLPAGDAKELLRKICLSDFTTPQIRTRDLATKFEIQASAVDLQNWAARQFLKPLRRGRQRENLFTLRDAIKAFAISHLTPANPLPLADEIALGIVEHAENLIAGGYDFLRAWEDNKLRVFFYEVIDAHYAKGIFISAEEAATKVACGAYGIDAHIFKAEECIFWTLCRYADWRYENPIEDLLGCDADGFPLDPNHPCYMTSNKK